MKSNLRLEMLAKATGAGMALLAIKDKKEEGVIKSKWIYKKRGLKRP